MMKRTHVVLMAILLACKNFYCQEHLVVLTYDFVEESSVGLTAEYEFTFSNLRLNGKYGLIIDSRRLAKSKDSAYYCAISKRKSKLGSIIAMHAILKDARFSQTLSGNDEFEGKLLLVEDDSLSCNCQVGEVQISEDYVPSSIENCSLLIVFEILDDFVTKKLSASKAQDNTQPGKKTLPKLLINPKVVSNLSDPDSVVSTDKKMVMVIEKDTTDSNFKNLTDAFTLHAATEDNDYKISLEDKQDASKSVTVMKISGYESTSPVLTKYTTVTKSVLNDLKAESEKEKKDSGADGKGGDDGSKTKLYLIIGIIGGIVLVVIIIIVVVCCYCCKKNDDASGKKKQAKAQQNAPGNGQERGQANGQPNANAQPNARGGGIEDPLPNDPLPAVYVSEGDRTPSPTHQFLSQGVNQDIVNFNNGPNRVIT